MMEYRIERGAADAKSLKMYFLYLSSGATPHLTLVGRQPSIKSGGGPGWSVVKDNSFKTMGNILTT